MSDWNFLELKSSVDDLVDFLELSMFINASLPSKFYLMKWIGDSDMKEKHSVTQPLYHLFLKTVTGDLNQLLIITVEENKYYTKKDDSV